MSHVYFNTLSGMMAARLGLKTVSDNVSNMQSPGFKAQSIFFSSMAGKNQYFEGLGSGVIADKPKLNFKQGNLQYTGVKENLAIEGNGFFILQMKNGEYRYTRDGQFQFNADGFLTDSHSGAFVMGYSQTGQLIKISNKGPKLYPGRATHEVDLKGRLVYEAIEDFNNSPLNRFKDIEFKIDVTDSKGRLHQLTVVLAVDETPATSPTQLRIKNVYENEHVHITSQISSRPISFFSEYPDENRNKSQFTLAFPECEKQTITLNFGKLNNDQDNYVKLIKKEDLDSSETKVEIRQRDGDIEGQQYDYSIDEYGQIHYLYTNDRINKGIQVALAHFTTPQDMLKPMGNNAFSANSLQTRVLGRANQGAFGRINAQKLELSNVDSTNEFTNIVILQRMFQACSQIMDIDKKLLEEMYNK